MKIGKPERYLDAVIIGAGFGGVYALYKLRNLGLNVCALEAGVGIGGTWFWNRYPAARCDVESLQYSYSFSPELQEEWKWPERYSAQPDLLAYINHVVDRFELRPLVETNTRVTAAVFNDATNLWTVETDKGEVIHAQYCIMATGNLSITNVPAFKGLESFKGKWFHTGNWPRQRVDFSGLRVGVVGTGSSGIQVIPEIAREAAHLHVFQRTPNYCVPAANRPLDAQTDSAYKKNYAERRREALDTPFCMGGFPAPIHRALDVSDDERNRTYQKKWEFGGAVSFLYSYKDLLIDKQANHTAAEFVRKKIREIVRNPNVAELLCPIDYPIGAKRLCVSDSYYETYNRENVTLVDVRDAPIIEITSDGLRTKAAHYELDALVFATGFDAITGALSEIEVRGSGGRTLRQAWAAGPRSYLGLMVAGFPNMFLITGPQSPSVKANMVCAIEQHVNWIGDCLKSIEAREAVRIEANQDAQDAWVEYSNRIVENTLYPLAESWYSGANIPGKPRSFALFVGGFEAFRHKCDEVAANGYEGFVISQSSARTRISSEA
ncbi:flavin-containing monooxygenase [Paraburkholderia sp.]|uniref:flavin-containing monooxygenase n=1 Tax=Paraburkholderia sp. TaxID=1926495 RepID=UPI0039E68890